MKKSLVDTDIIIDYLRGVDRAKIFIDDSVSNTDICVSIISMFEIIAGCRNKREVKTVENLLDRFITMYLDEVSIEAAYSLFKKYRLSHGISIFDSFIAASAIHNNMPLFTKNIKHFSMIQRLAVLKPY